MSWPAWAPLAADGWRIGWQAPRRRIAYDDGMAGEGPAGATRLERHEVEALLASDADRARFEAWLDALPSTGWPVLVALPPAGAVRACRIAGGRGGVRWHSESGPGPGATRRRWRAACTLETPDRDPDTVRARTTLAVVSSARASPPRRRRCASSRGPGRPPAGRSP